LEEEKMEREIWKERKKTENFGIWSPWNLQTIFHETCKYIHREREREGQKYMYI